MGIITQLYDMSFPRETVDFLCYLWNVHEYLISLQALVSQSRIFMELYRVLLDPPPPKNIIRLLC